MNVSAIIVCMVLCCLGGVFGQGWSQWGACDSKQCRSRSWGGRTEWTCGSFCPSTQEWSQWGECDDKTKCRPRTRGFQTEYECGPTCSGSGNGAGGNGGPSGSGFTPIGGDPVGSLNQACLRVHNEYRSNHGMPLLTWDEGIAANAQKWAESMMTRNSFEHSTDSPQYGENLAFASGNIPGNFGENSVRNWYDEICIYSNCRVQNSGTGHFTQVIWKGSKYVGCGFAKIPNTNTYFGVSQYYPRGNYIGQYCQNVDNPTLSTNKDTTVRTSNNKLCRGARLARG